MPQETPEQMEAKKAAARAWIVQFSARARFNLQTRDLRAAARTEPTCAAQIDLLRKYLAPADIDAALRGD